MARRRLSGKKINITMGDLLDQARAKGFDQPFIDFLDVTLRQFSGDFAEHSRSVARRMGAWDTGRLVDSIYPRSIVFKEGDAKAGIALELYGIFVNAGVGRGTMSTERATGTPLTSSRSFSGQRTPRPFLDESAAAAEIELEQLLSIRGADFITGLLAENMASSLRIEL